MRPTDQLSRFDFFLFFFEECSRVKNALIDKNMIKANYADNAGRINGYVALN